MLRIIQATIKTIDEKNHVRVFTEKTVDLSSLDFGIKKASVKPTVKETKVPEEPKDSKNEGKNKKDKKKIKV